MKYTLKCSVYRLTDLNKGERDPKTNEPLPANIVSKFETKYSIDVTLEDKSTPSVIVEKAKSWMMLDSTPTDEVLKAGKDILPLDGTSPVEARSLSYDVTLPQKS